MCQIYDHLITRLLKACWIISQVSAPDLPKFAHNFMHIRCSLKLTAHYLHLNVYLMLYILEKGLTDINWQLMNCTIVNAIIFTILYLYRVLKISPGTFYSAHVFHKINLPLKKSQQVSAVVWKVSQSPKRNKHVPTTSYTSVTVNVFVEDWNSCHWLIEFLVCQWEMTSRLTTERAPPRQRWCVEARCKRWWEGSRSRWYIVGSKENEGGGERGRTHRTRPWRVQEQENARERESAYSLQII